MEKLTNDDQADRALSSGKSRKSKRTQSPRHTNTTSDPITSTEKRQSNM